MLLTDLFTTFFVIWNTKYLHSSNVEYLELRFPYRAYQSSKLHGSNFYRCNSFHSSAYHCTKSSTKGLQTLVILFFIKLSVIVVALFLTVIIWTTQSTYQTGHFSYAIQRFQSI